VISWYRVRQYFYVLLTIWIVFAAVFALVGLAFGNLGPFVLVPVLTVATIAGIVSVARQS